MFEKFVNRADFNSYEDFYAHFQVNTPEGFNFAFDVMDALANETPNERALVWCDEKGDSVTFTYADIARLSNQAARVFLAAGVRRGDPVMLILKRRWEYWPILLALHKIRAVAIPATHLLTKKDIVYRCRAADIKGIVAVDDDVVSGHIADAMKEMRDDGNKAVPFISSLRDFRPQMEAANAAPVPRGEHESNSDTMLLYFTSGTTGMPKMVRHDFAYPLGHIVTAAFWHRDRPGGLHLTVADTGWAKAAWGKIYGQWLCRTAVFVYDYDKFKPAELLNVVTRNRVTNFCAPPTIYRFFIKEDLSKYDFSALEHCCVAGEPLNPEIYEQWKAKTGLKLCECYGQTELTVVVGNWEWFEPKPGSMGKPSPGYDLHLVREEIDGHLVPCAAGEVGEIVIYTDKQKPAGMFGGYYRDDELTKSVWDKGLYHTGDMAWRDEDGNIWFVGRADDVIKSSGYRIGPFEVESALLEHPAVLECAITGVPDADRGAVVKASIILAKDYAGLDAAGREALKKELQNHVKKTTAPYKYPRIVEFVAELPRTISGKIRRVEIRAGDGAGGGEN